ncbi:hypothetical protein J7E88_10085 [Streptomyces sp. ISL-10]|uniref:hypothetical protein n=1 Tax=Streptomyces sp. ISL-10 TaxID=2819172 RepID=UPI001BE9B6F5|nr:hypothetical protein [Streptomyces sp. ISL-10]MBT2365659.1 hypothetical protein [Streptomyces sp. ISL-10]
MTKTMTGAALLSGYVLGRTRKGKVAIALATWTLRKKIDPKKVSALVMGSPAVGELRDQIRDELLTAGKEAAATAVAARADRLADSLHERTLGMRQETSEGEKEKRGRRRQDVSDEPRTDGGENGDEDEPESRPAPRTGKRQPAQARSDRPAKSASRPKSGESAARADRPRRSAAERDRERTRGSRSETGGTREKRRSEA